VSTRYTNLRAIGSGAYGKVVSADDCGDGISPQQQKKRVAIKKIADAFVHTTDAKRILRELKLLRHLGGHENVSWILDVMVGPTSGIPTGAIRDVYIVTDLMECDLAKVIESPQALSDAHTKFFVYQLLRGLRFLHSSGILHRDLKPQNLFVNSNCELVIGDFGLARALSDPEGNSGGAGGCVGGAAGNGCGELTTYVVTRWYRAPELLVSAKEYDQGVDIWAAGLILAELLGRRPLLPGRNYSHQLQLTLELLGTPSEAELQWMKDQNLPALRHIRSLPQRKRIPWARLFPDANPLALDLLDRMLTFDPRRRITTLEALAHPYLADYACPEDEPCGPPVPADAFDFDTQQKSLARSDVQRLILAEAAHYKGGAGLYGLARPASARVSAHALATAATASSAPSAARLTRELAGLGAGLGGQHRTSAPTSSTQPQLQYPQQQPTTLAAANASASNALRVDKGRRATASVGELLPPSEPAANGALLPQIAATQRAIALTAATAASSNAPRPTASQQPQQHRLLSQAPVAPPIKGREPPAGTAATHRSGAADGTVSVMPPAPTMLLSANTAVIPVCSTVSASLDPSSAGVRAMGGARSDLPARPAPEVVPRKAAEVLKAAVDSNSSRSAATNAADKAIVSSQAADLVNIFIEQMRGIRTDLLSLVDTKLSAMEQRIEHKISAAMEPTLARLATLEAAVVQLQTSAVRLDRAPASVQSHSTIYSVGSSISGTESGPTGHSNAVPATAVASYLGVAVRSKADQRLCVEPEATSPSSRPPRANSASPPLMKTAV
jgi:serine/threonine protein kinase